MSKKIRLLIEAALDQSDVLGGNASATDQPKSLQQVILRNWAVLAESSGIELEQLKKLRDGNTKPSEVEILRIALTLNLSESFVSGLPLQNGGKQPNGVT